MQGATQFPIVKLPAVEECVEAFASLFGIGISQDQKLTVARTYGKMQERYAHLDAGDTGSLIETLAGISIYPGEEPPQELRRILSGHIGNLQQLVSWIRACLVYETPDQSWLNRDLLLNIVAPQVAFLLGDVFPELPEYSPLKQLDHSAFALQEHGYHPVNACKARMRELLEEGSPRLKLTGLGFRKALNALDERSAKTPSVQRRELMDLDAELGAMRDLDPSQRRQCIDEMTGVYAAMMVFKRLEKIVGEWSPNFFRQFVSQLLDDMLALSESRSVADLPLRLAAHYSLLQDLNQPAIEQAFFPTAKPADTPTFQRVLDLCECFSSTDESEPLTSFLRTGIDESVTREMLLEICRQLDAIADRPYVGGVRAFVRGALALCDNEIVDADARLDECLAASDHWPLGIFRNQSALLRLGIKLSGDEPPTPQGVNPLLAIYLSSLPQEYAVILEPDSADTTEALNLRTLVRRYNGICSALCNASTAAPARFVNPLRKVESHLAQIFRALDDENLPVTEENLRRVSLRLTGQRERKRIKTDFIGTSLYEWLSTGDMAEALRYFDVRDLTTILPSMYRYTRLAPGLRQAIVDAADPNRDGVK